MLKMMKRRRKKIMARRTTEEDPFLFPWTIVKDFTFSNMSVILDENVGAILWF